jgi:hypothetical protein
MVLVTKIKYRKIENKPKSSFENDGINPEPLSMKKKNE